jgi:hypothetical protein
MSISDTDEYNTLRQEMLAQFARIHDSVKWGTAGFGAFLLYYFGKEYPLIGTNGQILGLIILELIILLIGLSSLRIFHAIYLEGTFIAVILETDEKLHWHNMSRGYDDFLQRKDLTSFRDWFPFPLGKRWGGDSSQIALLLLGLNIIAISGFLFKMTNFNDFLSYFVSNCYFWLTCILIIINLYIFYCLFWGIKNYMQITMVNWTKYKDDYGVIAKEGLKEGKL